MSTKSIIKGAKAVRIKEISNDADTNTHRSRQVKHIASTWQSTAYALTSRYTDTWHPEMAALAFSLAATVAIIVILVKSNNRPAPTLSMGVTLNAVVSVLATSSRATLIFAISNAMGQMKWIWFSGTQQRTLQASETFDSASRGPLGAIAVLFAKTRQSVASLGAIVTVLALAYDPFVQQLIVYENNLRYVPSTGVTVGQVHNLTEAQPSPAFTQAMNAAIWTDGFELRPECPTGNCTWTPFRSLGFSWQCQSVPWSFPNGCHFNFTVQEVLNMVENNITSVGCTAVSSTGGSLNMSIPLSAFIYRSKTDTSISANFEIYLPKYQISGVAKDEKLGNAGWPYDQILLTTNSPVATSKPPQPILTTVVLEFNHIDAYMNRTNNDYLGPVPNPGITISSAQECSIDFILATHEIKMVNGKVTRRVSDEVFGRKIVEHPGYECWEPLNSPPLNVSKIWTDSDGLYTKVYDHTNQDFWFCSAASSMVNWKDLINNATSGNETVSNLQYAGLSPSDSISDLEKSRVNSLTYINTWPSFSRTTTAYVHRQGLETVIEKIATSFTNLAMNMNSNITSKDGMLGTMVAFVRVRWTWLVLPLTLNLGAVVFLLLVMLLSHRGNVPLWKSSVSALLYHGLEDDQAEGKPLRTIAEMDQQATKTEVRLICSENLDRLRFQTVTVH